MASSIPRVGVVTVTYNSAGVLDDFLDSMASQEGIELHLYAIDNASSDDSIARLRSEKRIEGLEIVVNDVNVGVASGNNLGIERALQDDCDWILLLNNDTLCTPSTIRNLVDEAEANRLDLVSPIIEATDPAATIWYSGGHFRPNQGFRTFHDNLGASTRMFPDERFPTGYASTCALLVRPKVFVNVGLMDPVYFVYFDDVDFAVRCVNAGYQYWVSPAGLVTHKASSITGGKSSPFTIKWYSRNWPLIARRHLPPLEALLALGFIQAWTFARVMTRRDSLSTFIRRQRSFVDGVTAAKAAPAPYPQRAPQ